MKNKKQRLKAIGAVALMLTSSMAAEAGKVSMLINGVPHGDYHAVNSNRERVRQGLRKIEEAKKVQDKTPQALPRKLLVDSNVVHDLTKSNEGIIGNGIPQGGTGTSSETPSRINSTNQATALYNLGQSQVTSKQFEASLNSFDESLLANPEYADAHHGRGFSLAQLKRHGEAVKSFDEALKYQSDFAMCHYNRACALQDLGRIEEAKDGFKVAVGLEPELQRQSRASKILQEEQTHDVDTQTTLSMLSESEISTQTENESKEIGVQVSSSRSSVSTQTDSVPISSSFAQTDSSAIGATAVATQTQIANSDQDVQTAPLKLSDSFSQTESRQEKLKQTEIGTSTDDLYELETSFDSKRIEDWDFESQSDHETNSWYSDSEVSIASSSLADTEETQSDKSTQTEDDTSLEVNQKSLSEFSSEVLTEEVQEKRAQATESIEQDSDLSLKEELRQLEYAELKVRKQEEVTKVLEETSKAGATLASTSSGVATNILNSISQRLNLNSMAAVAAGDEEERAELIGPNTGFYISPFVSKTNAKEFKNTSRYSGRSKGYTVGFDSRVNDLLLLGMSYTKADSHINFKQNHLGDKALIDSNFYSLYGQLMPQHQKYFLSTIAIYGKSDISSKARRGSSGTALGRHKAYSNILEVLAGSSQRLLKAFSVTPQLGLKYSRTKDAAYTEKVAVGTPSLIVGRAKSKDLGAIAGLKIDYRYNLSRDITLIPEVYGFASKAINSKAPLIRTKLQVQDDIILLPDIRAVHSKLDLSYGASVSIRAKYIDISAGYHALKARKLMSHAGSLKVKINL